MAKIRQNASFPGVRSVLRCSYTIGHGITPGTAVMVMAAQYKGGLPLLPAEFGDLVW